MKAKSSLGLILFPAFDWAISPTHPEREERLLYTRDQIMEEGLADVDGIHFFNPAVAVDADINRVHFCWPDAASVVPRSHRIAAGGVMRAFDAVLGGETDKAFALVRPPGHHAQRVVYGDRGFCIVNIEAVGLEYARQRYGLKRVAIVDTDCHHGDGTQDIYWNDPNTLFISFHQDGRTLYPGTGFMEELGGPAAYGHTINIPLPPGTGDAGFQYVLEQAVMPILAEFKPDLIINSAGQDNHYTDPLTNMSFSAQGYARLNQTLNPDIAVLEGGYAIQGALPYVNTGIILAMAGLDYTGVVEPEYREGKMRQSNRVMEEVKRVAEAAYALWHNRETLARDTFKHQKEVVRHRQVYYDTIGIMETQEQHFKICPYCAGVNYILSRNDRGASLLGITIPRSACSDCQEEGYRLLDDHRISSRQRFLQDRATDAWLTKKI
jgi:acetoin utilization deacetylase AcuC-like enzyme